MANLTGSVDWLEMGMPTTARPLGLGTMLAIPTATRWSGIGFHGFAAAGPATSMVMKVNERNRRAARRHGIGVTLPWAAERERCPRLGLPALPVRTNHPVPSMSPSDGLAY